MPATSPGAVKEMNCFSSPFIDILKTIVWRRFQLLKISIDAV